MYFLFVFQDSLQDLDLRTHLKKGFKEQRVQEYHRNNKKDAPVTWKIVKEILLEVNRRQQELIYQNISLDCQKIA